MKSSPRAFTLLELVICICIVAILSVTLMVNFKGSFLKANFDDQVVQVVHILEQARSYSLTNFLVNDTEPAEYYLLTVSSTGITLVAQASVSSTLETVVLDSDISISSITGSESVYYFPPTGEICFDTLDCDSGINDISFTIVDSTGTYSQVISLNKYGGAPEVEE